MSADRSSAFSRRTFIRQAGVLAAGTGAITAAVAAGQTPATAPTAPRSTAPASAPSPPATAPPPASQPVSQPASQPASQPSNRIRLGFVGMGGRASQYLQDFLAQPDVSVAAIADVFDPNAARGAQMAAAKGHHPDVYRDFRKILERKDIDAIAIGTPDHWHALVTLYACQAGKDVYVEKPLSHTIAEGRAMVSAARRHNRITQMGTQIHATENYRRVVEIVQSGMLGEITKTRVWIARNDSPAGIGRPADGQPPANADYDMWLGPAPVRPFNEARFMFNWRYWWDYAGGTLADMSCHIIDLVYWALRLTAPESVMCGGGRYALHDIAETPDTMEAVWDFAPGAQRKTPMQLVLSLTEGNLEGINGKPLGIGFYGSEATVIADYDGHELLDKKNKPIADRPPKTIPPSPGHVREFLDSIKSRTRCSCDIEYGHQLTKVPLMANIALKVRAKLDWDDAKEQFVGNDAANALLTKQYRAPWTLPAV